MCLSDGENPHVWGPQFFKIGFAAMSIQSPALREESPAMLRLKSTSLALRPALLFFSESLTCSMQIETSREVL